MVKFSGLGFLLKHVERFEERSGSGQPMHATMIVQPTMEPPHQQSHAAHASDSDAFNVPKALTTNFILFHFILLIRNFP